MNVKKVAKKVGNSIIIELYEHEVKKAIEEAAIAALYEIGSEITSDAASNTPVDTGQLKNSWSFVVDESKLAVTIGSPLENAIWNEWGTGEYAVHGDGRKDRWSYQDYKGDWHYTRGKRPKRTLHNAFVKNKNVPQMLLEKKLKDMVGTKLTGNSKIDELIRQIKKGKQLYEKLERDIQTLTEKEDFIDKTVKDIESTIKKL